MTVRSKGKYPTKSQTLVADVCRYQNDGTATITPSRFIERAEEESDGWNEEFQKAIDEYLAGGGKAAFDAAVKKIAADISRTCDRVRTGQLKASFEGKIQ